MGREGTGEVSPKARSTSGGWVGRDDSSAGPDSMAQTLDCDKTSAIERRLMEEALGTVRSIWPSQRCSHGRWQ
jgi:hypothetical protein